MKKVILIDPFNQTVEMKQVQTEEYSGIKDFDHKSLLAYDGVQLAGCGPSGG
jgi:hypothetical protein